LLDIYIILVILIIKQIPNNCNILDKSLNKERMFAFNGTYINGLRSGYGTYFGKLNNFNCMHKYIELNFGECISYIGLWEDNCPVRSPSVVSCNIIDKIRNYNPLEINNIDVAISINKNTKFKSNELFTIHRSNLLARYSYL
jgi:hypothetical protein